MLSYKTIEPHTLELLKKLTPELFLAKARLVGGTALALQYGHRMSIDLNFFGDIEEDSIAIRDILRSIGPIPVYKETTNIKIYSVNGIVDANVAEVQRILQQPVGAGAICSISACHKSCLIRSLI